MTADFNNYYHYYDIISKTVRTGFGSIIIRIHALQPPQARFPFLLSLSLLLLFPRRPKKKKIIIKNIR